MTDAIEYPARFLRLATDNVPDPKIWMIGDTRIFFDWVVLPADHLCIEIRKRPFKDCIAIATSETNVLAEEKFDGKTIPPKILALLESISND